ncbi:MAG: hypothetical protein ACRELA_03955 [Candidatus Rokuibacteriota bacterium]
MSAISREDRQAFVELLRADGLLLPDAPPAGVCRDPDDDDRLGCAAAGGTDYLVTGERVRLPQADASVWTPRFSPRLATG